MASTGSVRTPGTAKTGSAAAQIADKQTHTGGPTCGPASMGLTSRSQASGAYAVTEAEGNTDGLAKASTCLTSRGLRPWHARRAGFWVESTRGR